MTRGWQMIDEHGKGRPLLRPVSRVAGKRDGGLTCPWSQPASATPAWAITATSSVDAAARPKGRRPTFRRFLILTPHPSPNMAAASSRVCNVSPAPSAAPGNATKERSSTIARNPRMKGGTIGGSFVRDACRPGTSER